MYPIKAILSKPDMSGRLAKWAIKLGLYGIEYEPRKAIKGQAVADFMLEFNTEEEMVATEVEKEMNLLRGWSMYIEGSSTQHGAGCGVVLVTSDGLMLKQMIKLDFKASNNETEYETLLADLRLANVPQVKQLHIYIDSHTFPEARTR